LSKFSTLNEVVKHSQSSKVLFVEDNLEIRESTVILLNELFDEVHIAVDGEDGLTQYRDFYKNNNSYFDIVISDIRMPNLDGVALSKSIYNINQKQKIIIISAYNETEYLLPLINMGVNGFIQKPLSLEAIIEVLSPIYLKS